MACDPIHGWRGPFQPEPHANGYRFIMCKGKKFSVHSIVAELFLQPKPSDSHTIDHINRDRSDNRIENLRWANKSEQRENQSRSSPKQQCLPVLVRHVIWDDNTPSLRFESCLQVSKYLDLTPCTVNAALRRGWRLKNKEFTASYCTETITIPGEVWRQTGKLIVSNMGRIKRPSSRNNELYSAAFTPVPSAKNTYALYNNQRIHLLVASLFLPPKPPGNYTIDHINKDPADNRASNLRWATKSEQSKNRNVKRKAACLSTRVEAMVAGEWVSFDSLSEAARRLSSIYNVNFFANTVGRAAKQHKMCHGIKLRTV